MIDDLRSLRAFIVTAEELNFRRAAERLHMSQPPLSRMIAGLEESLETKLFERSTRSVNLTTAGIRFYKEALALLEQADGLARRMKSESQARRRRFPIGCTAAAYCTEFPRMVARLRELHADMEIELHEMNSDAQLDALAATKIDAGIVLLPAAQPELEFAPFARIRMQMALPAAHPMADLREPVALADLRRDVFIVHTREENPAMYHEILHHCAKAGFRPKTLTKKKGQNCMAMVASGAGVHFTAATGRCTSVEGVKFVPLAGEAPVLEMALAWRKGDEMPAIASLRSLIPGS
ncbi:LysR family transcriptional regulator [Luteolibacter sp. GHJ8]|uniref:LysR family transcriptional regulator n=1 Tax=Luteolibacter rhizosphaerae TaxID=2989719 RepID=A0ABT3G5Y4_9BACT|nr:LysR family transcriptional regulator [Luteolibacter rhizosphaerae]MCW1914979.1 LysR family transcriptional regulator [Luteolibacter rhizosphaerae]